MCYSSILSGFNNQLNELQKTNQNFLNQANLGYVLCTKTLSLLRKTVEDHGFKDSEKEIHFFKNIKMEPMRYLIYYSEVRSCELRLPKIGVKQQKGFITGQIKKVNTFFGKNIDFLLYMEQSLTHFDKLYFTRKNVDNGLLVKSYPYFKDSVFNTSHDGVWAKIRGMGLFISYLKIKKEELDNNKVEKCFSDIIWTGSYSAFVEMIYGCQAMGYFNNGNISTNQIIEVFSDFLSIKKGNSSRTYNEIKARKGNRIKFFDETGKKLLDKMDEEDGLDK